jgi:RND family efflux transporter MFP subunit
LKNFFLGFIAATVLVGGGYGIYTRLKHHESVPTAPKAAAVYHCPMHPQYTSDKPGDCPICGMKLVPAETGEPKAAPHSHEADAGGVKSARTERRVLYYTDAMRPGSRYDKPGKAPDGMDLVPVYDEESTGESTSTVPGYATVRIPGDRLQMMGVTLDEARMMDFEQSIRTVGRVTVDETRVHHVHTKFEGFIEELFVNFVGQQVRKGDPLFSIYSPELLATQREYLLALKAKEQMSQSGQDTSLPGVDLLEAARQRLALWDIGPGQIDELTRTRKPIRALILKSPVTGFVSAKVAVQGMKIMPADAAYDITDLSAVWVMADIYEVNLPFIRVGQPVLVNLPYQPNRKRNGRINYVDPTLDPQTRTVKARIELANPDETLKPDMYAELELKGSLGRGLGVPESAVISTGERYVVFVAKEEGVYEPREIKIGLRMRGFYQVASGLRAGEKLATQANFLLDSESKLKAILSGLGSAHEQKQ